MNSEESGEASSPEGLISRDDVIHVARLARLELSVEEVDLYQAQLAAILGHASAIGSLELDKVEPMSHSFALANVLRSDEISPCLDRDEVLGAAPASEDGRFLVPRILEES